jgi:hypothetical protein
LVGPPQYPSTEVFGVTVPPPDPLPPDPLPPDPLPESLPELDDPPPLPQAASISAAANAVTGTNVDRFKRFVIVNMMEIPKVA